MRGAPSAADLAGVLGYRFTDESLVVRALTHASAVGGAGRSNYQRLEFLGDRVLGLVVAEMLFEAFPEGDEGDLSRRLAALVRRETCADVAREIGLGERVWLGEGEAQTGGRRKEAILGDVCEAVIGAIYLDGGLAPAAEFVRRYWAARMNASSPRLKDAKTTLQEWAHAAGHGSPVYRNVGRTGPDHSPLFTVSVRLQDLEPVEGEGPSKRSAEQAAAEAMLLREGVWQVGADERD